LVNVEVIGEAVLTKFARKYDRARRPLQNFLKVPQEAQWRRFLDVKQSFSGVDYTPSGWTVFDIGGNKYRLIAKIDFEEQVLLIEKIMTHEEYDREEF
jgi:mRNA interferase HigB